MRVVHLGGVHRGRSSSRGIAYAKGVQLWVVHQAIDFSGVDSGDQRGFERLRGQAPAVREDAADDVVASRRVPPAGLLCLMFPSAGALHVDVGRATGPIFSPPLSIPPAFCMRRGLGEKKNAIEFSLTPDQVCVYILRDAAWGIINRIHPIDGHME